MRVTKHPEAVVVNLGGLASMPWASSIVAIAIIASTATASTPASDNAADPAYNSGWTDGSNGGSGWGGPWSISAYGGAGTFFTGSSTTNGVGDPDGDGDINTPRSAVGRAWGMTAPYPDQVAAFRPFNGPLAVGQTFTIEMDNGSDSFQSGNEVDWGLYDGGDTEFRFFADPGFTDYYIFDGRDARGGPIIHTGVPKTDQGIRCAFTLTGSDSYSLAITPLIAGASTTTITGPLIFGGPIDHVTLADNSGGSTSQQAVYFNNISITPEPGTLSVLAVGTVTLLRRRARSPR